MRSDRGLTDTPFLGPWLSAASTAFDTWIGFWTAAVPRQQAALMAEFQRQAMRAWTAPLTTLAGAERSAPPREPGPALRLPEPRPTPPVTPPLEAMAEALPLRASPATVPPAPPEIAPAQREETPDSEAPAEKEPTPRPHKASKGAAQLRATPARKAAPRKPAARKTTARKSSGRGGKGSRTRH